MANPSRTQPDAEHEAEAAQQAEIAADVSPASETVVTTEPTPPDIAGTPAEEPPVVKEVTLVPTDKVEEYPVIVSLVGLEEDIIFEDATASAEVTPAVAEQVRYLANVGVAA